MAPVNILSIKDKNIRNIGISKMVVIPAIDLKDGQCVRLRQGLIILDGVLR